jgi:hypothetical protein
VGVLDSEVVVGFEFDGVVVKEVFMLDLEGVGVENGPLAE